MSLLQKQFPKTKIYLSDNMFGLMKYYDAVKFLIKDKTSLRKYEKEIFDCDDFSRTLWFYWRDWSSYLAIGMAWTKFHAFNIFVDERKKIFIIEPQLDMMYPVDKIKHNLNYYPPEFILI